MRKNKIGILGAAAIAAANLLGGVNQVSANDSNVVNQQTKKEALHQEKKVSRPEAEKNKFGGFSGMQNPYKHIRKGGRNQRQYRKWLRSNPHMRRSKKVK
jgi:hypothetical protein